MKSTLGWLVAGTLTVTGLGPAGLSLAAKKKAAKKDEPTEAVAKPRLHPVHGIPIYEGAQEASEKTMRGLGLDAFDGYRVGVFFTNAKAEDVAIFYVKGLGRTVKKEVSDGVLRYTLMIEAPSGENPLGEKVVVEQSEGGVKDEAGTQYKTSIAVFRKAVEKKTDAK